jgi:alpha-beta hydrolase superfamily lysophospholipase
MKKPTLVIWGCKDTALNKDLAALPAKYVPNLTVKYIEDASHWVQMDKPDEVNNYMREWLSSSFIKKKKKSESYRIIILLNYAYFCRLYTGI